MRFIIQAIEVHNHDERVIVERVFLFAGNRQFGPEAKSCLIRTSLTLQVYDHDYVYRTKL
jgi:hypothetical protein